MEKYRFISINSTLAKYHRDVREGNVNESDLIEWIGEALSIMKISSASEEALHIAEVKNFHVDIPDRLHYIIQIARDLEWSKDTCKTKGLCPAEILTASENVAQIPTVQDCDGNIITQYKLTNYSQIFNLNYLYNNWSNSSIYKSRFSPVRLANHSLFNSLVCKDVEPQDYTRDNGEDEYTVVGDKIRFSFREGLVSIPYLRQRIDPETGYPMVPDNYYASSAINYYIIWKMKERDCWSHREGACQLAEKAQRLWDDYIRKFINDAKMPSGIDQHQNLAEQSRYMIPRLNRYYSFFGKLGTQENRVFKDPRNTQR